ncbi:MAG: tRNA (adenosine(37)-N6)-dimethylallyltransferase MiaA [Nitrospirae bacterium]|nr:tRNA (adenosine(37)-N6)-dimethylallyltransferase MiaA [Nitrospirota bacterium]
MNDSASKASERGRLHPASPGLHSAVCNRCVEGATRAPIRNKPLIVLVGPTAVGKSATAIRLAERLRTELISADSRMVYRGMDVGTAKPGPGERARVVHHGIDIVDPDELFSAGRFKVLAEAVIERLHREGSIPIIVGGTGLYVKLLLHGLWSGPEADWPFRERLYEAERREGVGYLHQRLKKVDPDSAGAIKPQDRSKLVRAIEVYEKTGRPLSDHHREHRFSEKPYEAILIGLRRSRADLYRRIEARVDKMMANGLVEEVRGLIEKDYSSELPAMKGLGYRQIVGYIKGEYDQAEAIHRLKRDTRQYAKRQFTWFNRDPSIRWIDLAERDSDKEAYLKVESIIHAHSV